MANYDYKAMKAFIQKYSDHIDQVQAGMTEDWFWTAETIYENGSFTINLDDEPEIGGIKGSKWATPSMLVTMKDGEDRWVDSYVGAEPSGNKPEWLELGVLSGPCQDSVNASRTPRLESK